MLFVSPFGWDDVASYRARCDWASALARAGHPVLRFDRPGVGDSPGDEEPGWLGQATEATAAAAAWLRTESGDRRVVALGIGLGGILALRALAAGAPIDDLVLWAVPSSGRRFLRELRSAGRAEASLLGGDESEGGDITFGGYTIDGDTVAELERLELAELELLDCRGRRALVIGRDRIDPDRALVSALEQAGFDVTAQQGSGFADMTIQPNESRLSEQVAGEVQAFLASLPTAPAATAPGRVPASADIAVTNAVVERPLTIEQPFGSLAAVVSEPETGASDLTLVLLNAGGVRRSGPSRMWVEIARGAAAHGVRAVRLDLEGIGDSDGDGAPYADPVALYSHTLVDQVCAAVAECADQGLGSRFALLGLCSGAWWAFQGALAGTRVVAAIMLNPGTLFTADPRVEAARDARRIRRQLLQWSSWRRVLTGEIPFGRKRLVALLRVLVGRAVGRQPRGRRSFGALCVLDGVDRRSRTRDDRLVGR